jgi:NAD(P)-dependent dehydrogenase (short-subunit alcohol dehydrogenase family)
MNELRSLFPTQIVRGGLLRADGVAVGLVAGGAPPWDLMDSQARAGAGGDYHRLLLAQHAPIDIYLIDHAPNLSSAIGALLDRRDTADNDAQAAVLEEIAERLAELAQHGGSRAKQVIWAVSAAPSAAAARGGGRPITSLLSRAPKTNKFTRSTPGLAALAQAVEQARRLAEALSVLGGTPPPRLMEAEEIARVIYQLADPVRAQRYPLSGTLLNRVQRIIAPAPS